MENRIPDPVVSSVGRWSHVGPRPQAKAVTVYRWRPSHAATPVHAVTDQGGEFARFQIRPDGERLQLHARHLERRSAYDYRLPETSKENRLYLLKVLNNKQL